MHRVPNATFVLLIAAMAAVLGCDAFVLARIQALNSDSAHFQQAVITELTHIRQLEAAANDDQHEDIEELVADLARTKQEAASSAGDAKRDAQRYAERVTRRLAQARTKRQVRTDEELTSLQAVAVAANAMADTLRSQVEEAESAAAAHKAEAASTRTGVSEAARALHDLHGRIARDGAELARLRAAGDREYLEFNLTKQGQIVIAEGFTLILRKVDAKRNRYAIDLLAGTRRIEIRDCGVYEPVRFYAEQSSRPHELVVNHVDESGVRGYIAAPKLTEWAGVYSSGSAETSSLTPGR